MNFLYFIEYVPEGHEVCGGGGAEVGLLGELHQAVHAVFCVRQHVLGNRARIRGLKEHIVWSRNQIQIS